MNRISSYKTAVFSWISVSILFFSSYAPLCVIFAIKDNFCNTLFCIFLLICALLSVIFLIVFLYSIKSMNTNIITVESASSKDGEILSYVVTYLLPFLGVDLSKPEDIKSMLALFFVLYIIYTRSQMIQVNPMLSILQYSIFEVTDTQGITRSIISKKKFFRKGDSITFASPANNVCLEV